MYIYTVICGAVWLSDEGSEFRAMGVDLGSCNKNTFPFVLCIRALGIVCRPISSALQVSEGKGSFSPLSPLDLPLFSDFGSASCPLGFSFVSAEWFVSSPLDLMLVSVSE